MPIAKRIEEALSRGSWIRKLFEEGAAMSRDGSGLPVYDFSIGNPDLDPPPLFKKKLMEIAADTTPGLHKYMPNTGFSETRDAVARSLKNDYNLPFTGGNIVMTVGAGGAINAILKALLDEGEEVIAPIPYFVEYGFYVSNHQGKLVTVPSKENFDLDIDAIAAAITPKTRIIIITNPNNPTGIMYPQETLDKLGKLLREKSEGLSRPIFLLDDAPYRKLVYDTDRCTSAFAAYPNTLMATSHSKDLGIPGERIGFIAVSPQIAGWEKIVDACAFTNRTLGFVNAPGLMQKVCASLQEETIDLDWYRRKRDRLYTSLTDMGYEVPYPAGAFYMFPKSPIDDDVAFVNMLKEHRVLVVPGRGFGMPGYFRISYCVSDDKIEGSLTAFKTVIDTIHNG